jgi:hypothetical protein
MESSGSSIGRAAGLYPASTRSVRDPSSSLGRSMMIAECRLPICDWVERPFSVLNRQSAFDNRQWLGPEAHQDEFSTFNREVVGSTPTRPTNEIGDCRLAIAELRNWRSRGARSITEQCAIGNWQSAIGNEER